MPNIDPILLEMISHELSHHCEGMPLYENFLLNLVESIFDLQDGDNDDIEESWSDNND